jgi:hypothetical protein
VVERANLSPEALQPNENKLITTAPNLLETDQPGRPPKTHSESHNTTTKHKHSSPISPRNHQKPKHQTGRPLPPRIQTEIQNEPHGTRRPGIAEHAYLMEPRDSSSHTPGLPSRNPSDQPKPYRNPART